MASGLGVVTARLDTVEANITAEVRVVSTSLAAQEAAVATLQKRVAVVEQALADATLSANAAPALPTVEPGTVVVSAPAGTCLEDVCKFLRSAATEAGMILVVGGAKPWRNQPRPQEAVFIDVDVPLGLRLPLITHPMIRASLTANKVYVSDALTAAGRKLKKSRQATFSKLKQEGQEPVWRGAEVWVKSSEPGKKRVQYVGPWVEQGSDSMDP